METRGDTEVAEEKEISFNAMVKPIYQFLEGSYSLSTSLSRALIRRSLRWLPLLLINDSFRT